MPRLGPQGCCRELEEELQSVKEKQHDIKQALRRVSKEKAETRRRRRHSEQVALHVLCQSGGNRGLLQHFLERMLGQEASAEAAVSFDAIVHSYEAMSGEQIKELREPTALLKPTAVARQAARFLKECHLAKWVERRNMDQHIAPVVSLVAQQARASKCLPPDPTSTKWTSQLQWLRRWRRRWSITLGRIAAREYVPPEEARRKACPNEEGFPTGVRIRANFWAAFLERGRPERGPSDGPGFGPACLYLEEGRVQFPAPFLEQLAELSSNAGTGGLAVVQFSPCSRDAP